MIENHSKLPYRLNVGIVVFNHENDVWIGRRQGASELMDSDQLWQFPQGGIDKGEDPFDAAKRELYEETNMRSLSFLAETQDWLYYDLPEHLIGTALKGKFRGQKQKWFAFRFEGKSNEIDIATPAGGAHKAEFDDWRWESFDEILDLIVPFKREVYKKVIAAFSHIRSV